MLATSFPAIVCRQAQSVQQINQCSNEEYFNVNQLRCVKCEQTVNHQPDGDFFSALYPKTFNQGFGSNLVLGNQNYSFNSHLSASSSSPISLQVQSNLERSEDGLSCVCKKGKVFKCDLSVHNNFLGSGN